MVNAVAVSSSSVVRRPIDPPAREVPPVGGAELMIPAHDVFVDADVMARSAATRATIEARNKALVDEPKKFSKAISEKYEPCRLVQSLMASLGALDQLTSVTEPKRIHGVGLMDNALVLTARGFRSLDTASKGHSSRRRYRLVRKAAWNDEVRLLKALQPSVAVGQAETLDSARRRLDAALVESAQDIEKAARLYYPPDRLKGLFEAAPAEAATKAIPGAPYFSAALLQQALQQEKALQKRANDGIAEPKKLAAMLQFKNDAAKRTWLNDMRQSLAGLDGPMERRSKKEGVFYYIPLCDDLLLTKDGFCDRSMMPSKTSFKVPEGSTAAIEFAKILRKLAAVNDIHATAEKMVVRRSFMDRLLGRKK